MGSFEFTPPYQDGWQNTESGNTPITAEILNDNYDSFLLMLNDWITSVEGSLVSIPVNITAQTQTALAGLYDNLLIQNPASGQVLKFNGTKWVNANESGGGSTVSWEQIVQSGTQIATITINGTAYPVYAPNGGSGASALNDLSDVVVSSPTNGQILQYNASTSKWENVSAGGGGYEPTGEVYTFFTNGSRETSNLVLYVSWTDGESVITAEIVTFAEIISGWVTEDYRNITINWDRNTGSFNFVAKSGSFEYNGSYFDEGDTIGSLETGNVTFNAVEKEATNVSWTQIQASGTKIAEISIEGVSQNVYIPTPPANTSDLTNDSNFVADSSYVHTDNNYTTTEKNKLADLNQVEANPSSGTSAGNLNSIKIGGTKYDIPSGGGSGTDVEWTQIVQSGTKIAEIEIDGNITNVYAPTSGGGYTEVTGTLTAGQTSITLSDSSITTSSTIDVYTDNDVEYNSISVSTGSVTITFDAQASNMGVKVRVS